jgi:heme/copper-type cytochrome/quinol oxidase subunit 4
MKENIRINNEHQRASMATLKAYLIGLIESEKVNVGYLLCIVNYFFKYPLFISIRRKNTMILLPVGDKVIYFVLPKILLCNRAYLSVILKVIFFLYVCSDFVKYVLLREMNEIIIIAHLENDYREISYS